MFIVVRKSNIALIGLAFLLAIAIYSLNIGRTEKAVVTVVPPVQKTVIVDAGHGGEDPGATSDYSGLREKDLNLTIAFMVKELLENDNYKVILTRSEDKLNYQAETRDIFIKRKEDLESRKKTMDNAGADIVVSIHMNKFDQTKYWGAQTFYPPKSIESQKLANSLQKSLRDMVQPDNKREPQLDNRGIIIMSNIKTPTVIAECGFLSNSDEEKMLGIKEHQQKLAAAIKAGIDSYFK